jgi:CDI immunity proteins
MNTSRTIEQLEATQWPEPSRDATALVHRCHALRRVPLAKLGNGDLRVLIGQGISLKYLMPIALTALEEAPMLEAEYYPGDLLCAAMSAQRSFWVESPNVLARLAHLAQQAQLRIAGHEQPARFRQVAKDIARFQEQSAA